MNADLEIASTRVVLPEGIRPATIRIRGGVIADIRRGGRLRGRRFGDDLILPGLVDTHVHINEPGRTEWEGFASLTRAAAAGGVTTLVDMPLNSIPATTSPDALDAKRRAAAGQCHVDVGFWGGLVPGNTGDLEPMLAAGALGFKAFMVDSGVPEFPAASLEDLDLGLRVLARRRAPLLVHAEDPSVIAEQAHLLAQNPRSHEAWARCREGAERTAVASLVLLATTHGTRIHVVHLSTAAGVAVVRQARERGVPITAETCPHYLLFTGDQVPDGATQFKCAPPLGTLADREALWEGLNDGTIGMVVSDHSPCPPAMKGVGDGRFDRAWGGIASLQVGLPAVWTEARRRGCTPADLAAWMSTGPAGLAGLGGRKGLIAPGHDADLVILDPEARVVVDATALHHRHSITPYAGRELAGVVRATYLRGRLIYETKRLSTPTGRLL